MLNKKYISFFFLSVFLIPALFPVCAFLQQILIQHAMLEKLETANIETIHVKKAVIKWIRYGKEIEIYGKLFDVKDWTEDGESYTIKGLYDEKEARLMTVGKKVQEQSNSSNPTQQRLAKITSVVLFFETIKDLNFETGVINNTPFCIIGQKEFLSFCPQLLSPPPKV